MKILRFINPHRLSNTYLVYSSIDKKAIIIDVGDLDQQLLLDVLKNKSLTLEAVFLTHEHADHCCGVDELAKELDFKLFCTNECGVGISNSKLNFSRYLEDIDEFEITTPYIAITSEIIIISPNLVVESLPTPGHSPGSCCYLIENNLFTGDTVMPTKTPLSFPNSNKKDYIKSIDSIKRREEKITRIYPGHGEEMQGFPDNLLEINL